MKELFKIIIENLNDTILILDNNKKILYLSPSISKLTGYTLNQIKGKKLEIVFEDDRKKVKKKINKVYKKNKKKKIKYRIITKDNNIKWISHICSPILKNDDTDILINVLSDITKYKNIKDEKKMLSERVDHKNNDLKQVSFIISHELRTPLTNIQGFTRAVNYSIDKILKITNDSNIPDEQKQKIDNIIKNEIILYRNYIEKSIFSIDTIISGLVEILRLERSDLNYSNIDMNLLINELIDVFNESITEKKINIELKELSGCSGDRVQLYQVFYNLISNAIKFSKNNSGLIKIYSLDSEKDSVYCVEDNGIGIEKNDQFMIFELFKKVEKDSNNSKGLGLAIVNRIMSNHNGKVWLESQENIGSKFYISLPKVKVK